MQASYQAEPDQTLERLAATGDGDAFGELYNRHFDRVYDFVYRMVRDPDEAADVAQETFVRAMRALKPQEQGASFSTWALTIARNLALTRLGKKQRSTRLIDAEGVDDEEDQSGAVMHIVDESRLGDPEAAAQASDLSRLVWDAVAFLNPKESSVLDLHLRQGLESAEIAQVLGISKGNAYTILSRLKDALEEAVVTLVLIRNAREKCAELDQLVTVQSSSLLSPAMRRLVMRHIDVCPTCQEERKRLLSPSSLFGAFALVPIPFALKRRIAEALRRQWRVRTPASQPQAGGGSGDGGHVSLYGQRVSELARRFATWLAYHPRRLGHLAMRWSRGVSVMWPYRTARWKASFLGLTLTMLVLFGGGGGFLVWEGTSALAGGGSSAVLRKVKPPTIASPTPTSAPTPTPTATPEPKVTPTLAPSPSPAPIPTSADPQPTPEVRPTVPGGTVILPPSTWCEPESVALSGTATEDPSLATALVAKTNQYRASKGLTSLISDGRLLAAARDHAKFVVLSRWWTAHAGDVTIHCDADGWDQAERAVQAGYPIVYVGENVAWGSVGRPTDEILADIVASGEDPADSRFHYVGLACYTRSDLNEYACVQVMAE